MPLGLAIGLIAGALVVGALVGFIIRKISAESKLGSAEEQARKILEDAIKNAENAKKVVLHGLEDFIVSEKDGRILICKRSAEQRIKEFV
jgi:hypothetical protein